MTTDRLWAAAASYLRGLGVPAERIAAPREMAELVPGIVAYEKMAQAGRLEAVAVHKGLLQEIGAAPLADLERRLGPGFANEVFVVLRPGAADRAVLRTDHYRSYRLALEAGAGLTVAQIRERIAALAIPRPRAQPSGVYLGDGVVLTKNIFGHLMCVDARDRIVSPHVIHQGLWEPWTTRVFLALIRPGDTVVDAGANFGYYTVLGAWRTGPRGKVYAFEPMPRVARLCYDNANLGGFLGTTKVVMKGLSDRAERRELDVFERHPAAATLRRRDLAPAATGLDYWEGYNHPSIGVAREEVEVVPLDEALPRGARIDVMKIDVEGHELPLLRGARATLRASERVRIIMEYIPPYFSADHNRELLHLLRAELGFDPLYRIGHDASLTAVSDEDILGHGFQELLLVRPS